MDQDLIEIAEALASQQVFDDVPGYSYAQHAVLASRLAPRKAALSAMHDYMHMTSPGNRWDDDADAHVRQARCGEAPGRELPLGQFTYVREIVHACRKLHPRRARDLYLERYYELKGRAA